MVHSNPTTRAAEVKHENAGVRERALMATTSTSEEKERRSAMAVNLASDPDARVRFSAALVLGDNPGTDATNGLATVAAKDSEDRWLRAAVLSGIAGREQDFLVAFLNQIEDVGPGAQELLRGVGRGFQGPGRTQARARRRGWRAGLGRGLCGPAMASLLLSLFRGHGQAAHGFGDRAMAGARSRGGGADCARPVAHRRPARGVS